MTDLVGTVKQSPTTGSVVRIESSNDAFVWASVGAYVGYSDQEAADWPVIGVVPGTPAAKQADEALPALVERSNELARQIQQNEAELLLQNESGEKEIAAYAIAEMAETLYASAVTNETVRANKAELALKAAREQVLTRNREYGRASAMIGQLRANLARAREERREAIADGKRWQGTVRTVARLLGTSVDADGLTEQAIVQRLNSLPLGLHAGAQVKVAGHVAEVVPSTHIRVQFPCCVPGQAEVPLDIVEPTPVKRSEGQPPGGAGPRRPQRRAEVRFVPQGLAEALVSTLIGGR